MSSPDNNSFAEGNLWLDSMRSDANCNIDTHFEKIFKGASTAS